MFSNFFVHVHFCLNSRNNRGRAVFLLHTSAMLDWLSVYSWLDLWVSPMKAAFVKKNKPSNRRKIYHVSNCTSIWHNQYSNLKKKETTGVVTTKHQTCRQRKTTVVDYRKIVREPKRCKLLISRKNQSSATKYEALPKRWKGCSWFKSHRFFCQA